MSILDKAIAAVTPDADDEKKREARAKARASAGPSDWLAMVLDHHEQIESRFAAWRAADGVGARRMAQKELAQILAAHSLAEELVLYPAVSRTDHTVHSEMAYTQQSAAKVQLAALETMDPLSEDYMDKLGHLEGAVAQHVYQEESTWFTDLKRESGAEGNAMLTQRYDEEFRRYMGADADGRMAGTGSTTAGMSGSTPRNQAYTAGSGLEAGSPGSTVAHRASLD